MHLSPGLTPAVLAEPVHDPLFGDPEWTITTASEDPRDPPRRTAAAGAAVQPSHVAGEDDEEDASDDVMQAWTLSSLEAGPLEASPVAAASADVDQQGSAAGIWQRLSSAGHGAGYSGAHLPSGFVVDDLQSSGAALPQRMGLAAFEQAARGSRAAMEAVHDLYHPEGRGAGAALGLLCNLLV